MVLWQWRLQLNRHRLAAGLLPGAIYALKLPRPLPILVALWTMPDPELLTTV